MFKDINENGGSPFSLSIIISRSFKISCYVFFNREKKSKIKKRNEKTQFKFRKEVVAKVSEG